MRFYGRRAVFAMGAVALLALADSTRAAVDPSAWSNSMSIAFSGYDKSETLTNFPALVVFSSTMTNGFSYGQVASTNGYDLRFTDAQTNNWLNYEIEQWDLSGNSYVWVQVPVFTSNCSIRAYWNNAGAATQQPYTTNGSTWTEGYLGVWHMRVPNTQDSSTNANNGTGNGSVSATAGVADGALQFAGGSGNNVSLARVPPQPAGNQCTIETWVKSDSSSGEQEIFSGWMSTDYELMGGAFRVYTNSQWFSSGVTLDTVNWYYLALSQDASSARLFVNGVQRNAGGQGGFMLQSPVRIGSWYNGAYGFQGKVDEVRLSRVGRSANWLWACYESIALNATFTSYGPVAASGPVAPVIVDTAASAQTYQSATLNANMVLTGGVPTYVWVYWGTTDAGPTPAGWNVGTNYLGARGEGPVSYEVSGLQSDSPYYYRFYATNSAGESWGSATRFSTTFDTTKYPRRMKITFAGYAKPETLTNFPALVVMGTGMTNGFSYGGFASTNGYDLRFTDAQASTELKYELERWNTNGTSYVWVQVPQFTNSCSIWAYWGNAAATTQRPYTTNGSTWSEGYIGVWHMRATNEWDSSPYANNITGAGGDVNPTAGLVGSALQFNQPANNSYVQLATAPPVPPNTNYAIEAWVKWDGGNGSDQEIVSGWGAWDFEVNRYGVFNYYGGNPLGTQLSGVTLNTSDWYHVVVSQDPSLARMYVNGVQAHANAPSFQIAPTERIGNFYSGNYGFPGKIDEVRLSQVARSSNWLWACYRSIASNSAFTTYGSAAGTPRGTTVVVR